MGRRALVRAARGYSLDDVVAGLPATEAIDGQLELVPAEEIDVGGHRVVRYDPAQGGQRVISAGVEQQRIWE